ncbi:hypothetical protein IC229_15920 [Spirosoma sp. BT702]|uniref:Uncharacterized protein n=1 Tax=Spirosoma profusum TaxID=2771354 RepID=A0A926XWJ5_9BACT|nr:hypothetical protein [Spirosoma profusum]MBD2702139.1 hypothetical protein [Spirosoma profusum]
MMTLTNTMVRGRVSALLIRSLCSVISGTAPLLRRMIQWRIGVIKWIKK